MKLKIMTINLRYDKPDSGENAWTVRRKALAALIFHYVPDVIGTQEGLPHQLLDLHRLLPSYQSVGGDRSGTGTDQHCAIFYRKQRLHCLATGDFWLSETPDTPGSVTEEWGNPVPRIATWAVLGLVDGNSKITVFNTHLDYHSASARERSAPLICDRLSTLEIEDVENLREQSFFFVMGDFNAEPGEPPRETFSHLRERSPHPNVPHLKDALANVELEGQKSLHEFSGNAFVAVDTIYYDDRWTMREVKIDSNRWKGVWPSDHFPVVAEFESQ